MMLTQNMEAKILRRVRSLKKNKLLQRPFFAHSTLIKASLFGCQQRWTVQVVHKVAIYAQDIGDNKTLL